MKKVLWILMGVLLTQTACDLRPKIIAFPDTVGEFISARYPALLADPNTHPEIYNSAATDYGVYAAPDLYGTPQNQDYVLYASVDDYILPPQIQDELDSGAEIFVGDKQVDGASMYGALPKDETEDVLVVKKPIVGAKTETRVDLKSVVVESGDTLYSLSRRYSVPVNDLAVMNNLKPPFELSVGQVLRVPNLAAAPIVQDVQVKEKTQMYGNDKLATVSEETKESVQVEKKTVAEPVKKLPKINARSSSKFSWPVQGRILSAYGAKNNGLFNDGINIAASKGTTVNAAENGVVAYAGNEIKGMGNLIIIQHDAGWMTVYAHMDSMNVKRGTKVSVGQKIGTVGETGKVDSPQLHFEIRKGTKAYDPTSYMKN